MTKKSKRRSGTAPFTARRRVFWQASPRDLEPTFRDETRTVRMLRDGRLNLTRRHSSGGSSSGIEGRVQNGVIDCCALLLEHEDLDSLVDTEGMTLRERLRAR